MNPRSSAARPPRKLKCASAALALALFAGAAWTDPSSAPPAPPASRQVLDRYGHVLRTELSCEGTQSTPLPLAQVSPWLALSTLAIEDKRFFEHGGVDAQAVARAALQDLRAGRVVSGASTLTQQLARSLEPRPRTFWGKAQEALSAWHLERHYSKENILEAYLNRAPYGNQAVGAEAGAHEYFGVSASGLSLAQAALLAGIPKSPMNYDPRRHLKRALERQRQVLRALETGAWVDAESLRLARAETIKIVPRERLFAAPQFSQKVLAESPGEASLRTSLDGALQQDLQDLLREHIHSLSAEHVGNGALVVLDNHNGEILAYVGSQDFNADGVGQVDGASARRQPGSALKPFLYGLAFERGFKTSDLIQDEPYTAPDGYSPVNYDRSFHGSVSLRRALACSYNVPAVRLTQKLGVQRLLDQLHAFGLASLDQDAGHYGLGLALGNGEVTLLELASAYGALARGGSWIQPHWRLHAADVPSRRVLSSASCALVTDVLSDNGARAAAFGLSSPLVLPFDLAAKTGTTKDYRDNWCVGYTPDWTVAVWVGNFDAEPMRHVSGITGAAPLMHDAALRVFQDRPSRPFCLPPTVRRVEVCADSGELRGPRCPTTRLELYALWNLPQVVCHLHGAELAVPQRSGPLRVLYPAEGAVFKLDPLMDRGAQAIKFKCSAAPGARLSWSLDGKALALDAHGEPWWTLRPGAHEVQVTADDGRSTRHSSVGSFRVLR
jgi:penicillin-binding protein 1C